MIPIGVTTKKKTIPITIGEIKFPRNNPNLNHILFNGERRFEFKRPRIKKINEIAKDHTFGFSSFKTGNNEIIKKTMKKVIPKLRFELILIELAFKILN